MEIKKRLSYQFLGIVALILFISSLTIYLSFSGTRRSNFFDRLGSKANMVAQMLIEFDSINTELLNRIESNNPLSLPNEKIVIYDHLDQIIYSTDEELLLNLEAGTINDVRLTDEIRFKQTPFEIAGKFYTGEYGPFVVFVAAIDIFGLKKQNRLLIILLIVFPLCLVIAYFSSRVFATRSLRPISDIMSQVDAIGVSNLHARVNEGSGNDEINQLARTFNKMLNRLERVFNTQKNFISNASHELRTPLTVITGQLEVILLKARSNEEYRETILSLLDDIKNLNQISNRLLMLAKASSDFPETAFEPVRIDDTVWQARKEEQKRQEHYRIQVHFSDEIDSEYKLTVRGNDMLLRTAFVNLIDNGCKYSENNTVEVYFSYSEKELIIMFSDKGLGIPKEEIDLIFHPFYRAKNVVGIKGHGIGLSLVEKIVILHKGRITISSEENIGTDIIIYLPSEEQVA